ncbi:MAG: glycosyltransferase family protein [Ignavibacteria bacterium]|nr:glycosyltransferase family protein [Ignavibacteria bacterium]
MKKKQRENKIVTVIQARAGSTRLPNKIFLPLAGESLLFRIYERIKLSGATGTVFIAIPNEPSDDPVEQFCIEKKIPVFRGDTFDLLDRHYKAALKFNADAIVKIPSDCPLIDPNVITKVISYYLDHIENFDYVSNLHPATYPDGNDVEIMSLQALKKAWENAKKPFERVHTTPYFWENQNQFRIGNVKWEIGFDYSMTHRWTIDYYEDYLFIKAIYDVLYNQNPAFGIDDILKLVSQKPELMKINEMYAGVNWYRNHLNELKTIFAEQTKVSSSVSSSSSL